MGITTAKGEVGEAIVLADLQRQGHGVAIPFGDDLPYDLIVVRKEDGRLERVQCEYTTSNGRVVIARVMSNSVWVTHRYTKDEVDWIATYDLLSPFGGLGWTDGGEPSISANGQRPEEGNPFCGRFPTGRPRSSVRKVVWLSTTPTSNIGYLAGVAQW
ncbi:MAG: group I intron-associated PD-(D/E)XK endonuclease [Acidimicrobiia bacterium]